MKSGSPDDVRDGIYHLVAMADAKYRGADRVLVNTVSRVYGLHGKEYRLFDAIREALEAVAAFNLEPSDEAREELVTMRFGAIRRLDRDGFTGYWLPYPEQPPGS